MSDVDQFAGILETENVVSSSSEDEDDEEVWDEEKEDELERDLGQPLQVVHNKSRLGRVNEIVSWIVYFLLYWQASCHVGDNCLALL